MSLHCPLLWVCCVALRGCHPLFLIHGVTWWGFVKPPHGKDVSSSASSRVKQNFSCIPPSCPHCCVAVTLTPPLAPVLPIRALLSTQPLKPVCVIGRGRWCWGVLSAFFSPSLPECFSLTVCDSCTGNCSHTLSPPEVDHIPSVSPQLYLTPLLPSDGSAPRVQETYETLGDFIFKQTPCSIHILSAALPCLQRGTECLGFYWPLTSTCIRRYACVSSVRLSVLTGEGQTLDFFAPACVVQQRKRL